MQKRTHSLLEALGNTLLGLVISFGAAFIIYPIYGMEAPASAYLSVTLIYTVLSVARSYLVRRVGNWLQHRRLGHQEPAQP